MFENSICDIISSLFAATSGQNVHHSPLQDHWEMLAKHRCITPPAQSNPALPFSDAVSHTAP